ncbi:MAG: flagellar biosynthesis protein FlhB, partial [Chloroflexi bacterium]
MSGERTEAPTPRRVSDARAEGRVARSMELSGAAGLLAGVWLLQIFGQQMVEGLKGILSASFQSVSNLSAPDLGAQAGALLPLIPSLGFILLGVMVTGVSVNFAQTGLLWASKRIGFDFTRLNPL